MHQAQYLHNYLGEGVRGIDNLNASITPNQLLCNFISKLDTTYCILSTNALTSL